MLDVLFQQVLSCSLIGSYVIIAVMVTRLFLKKSPKIYSYVLWSVVFFRLLVPFTLESPLAILPETQSILPMKQETSTISQEKKENQVSTSGSPEVIISSSEFQDSVQNSTSVWSIIWCVGMSILVIPSLFSVVKLHKKLRISFHLEKNIYLVDSIDTPFVWGLLKPKIYLPSALKEEEKECVVPHEEYHLKRFDHLTRLLAFFTLILHWFNPLVWCAFVLSGRDMELSVDEKVIKNLVQESHSTAHESIIKKKYATLLLELGTKKSSFVPLYVTPTFRYGETRERVNHVMKMKKTKLWVSGLSAMLVMGFVVGFSTNTNQKKTPMASEPFHCFEQLEQVEKATIYHFHDTTTVSYDKMEKDGTNEVQYQELMSIFQKYTFTPVDYKEYASSGGGINERTGRFDPSIFYAYDITAPTDYRGDSFELRFFTSEDDFIEIDIFENGRGIISIGTEDFNHYRKPVEERLETLDEESDKPDFYYSYPFYLEGSNYELFNELMEYSDNNQFEGIMAMDFYTWN
ncbi:MAG: M56 family metallopeptidase [Eubacteriales bacterium]